MKALQEAVDELNALDKDTVRKMVSKYSNNTLSGARCSTCPVAKHLESETGVSVWVNGIGDVIPRGRLGERYKLALHVVDLISEFDDAQWLPL